MHQSIQRSCKWKSYNDPVFVHLPLIYLWIHIKESAYGSNGNTSERCKCPSDYGWHQERPRNMCKIICVLNTVTLISSSAEKIRGKKYPSNKTNQMKTKINKRLIEYSTIHIKRMDSKEKSYSIKQGHYRYPFDIWWGFLRFGENSDTRWEEKGDHECQNNSHNHIWFARIVDLIPDKTSIYYHQHSWNRKTWPESLEDFSDIFQRKERENVLHRRVV